MKQPYESPELVEYGQIADCTFGHPRRRNLHWRYDEPEDDGGSVPVFTT